MNDIEFKIKNDFNSSSDQEKDLSIRLYSKHIKLYIPKNSYTRREILNMRNYHKEEAISKLMINDNFDCKSLGDIILFPENYLSHIEKKRFLNKLLSYNELNNIIIVSTDPIIISDLINPLVNYVTIYKTGGIKFSTLDVKTLGYNVHTFFYKIISEGKRAMPDKASNIIQNLIDESNKKTPISQDYYEKLISDINMIGEEFMAHKIKEQLESRLINL